MYYYNICIISDFSDWKFKLCEFLTLEQFILILNIQNLNTYKKKIAFWGTLYSILKH